MEPFSKGQAWIDLFGNANHKEGSMSVRGNTVKVGRGQIAWSELTMAKRWRWSRNKVRRFLHGLEMEQQIEQQTIHKITSLITIKQYDEYQGYDSETIHQKVQQTIHKQEDKNVKNKELIHAPPAGDLIDQLLSEKREIQYDWQYVGLEVYEKMGAPKEKKGECMRIAKTYGTDLCYQAMASAKLYTGTIPRWMLFLRAINDLKKKHGTIPTQTGKPN